MIFGCFVFLFIILQKFLSIFYVKESRNR